MSRCAGPFPSSATPLGYQALIEQYQLQVLPLDRCSYLLSQGARRTEVNDGQEEHYYPKSYCRADLSDPWAHLEFALNHEGIQLGVLEALFRVPEIRDLCLSRIQETPFGIVNRKMWFLYEFLTGNELPLPSAQKGTYVPLLDPAGYYTGPPRRSPRHKVVNNLLGNRDFCPLVRRTEMLISFEKSGLSAQTEEMLRSFDASIIERAIRYLYLKETRSSFEIEHESPTPGKAHRFVALLHRIDLGERFDKPGCIRWQQAIVDPRFAATDWRDFQNYIGIAARLDSSLCSVEYIPPRPEDVAALMEGLIQCADQLRSSQCPAAIVAAIIAFGFVYIHPFEDGNGRIHRLLVHLILSAMGFTPPGLILPVSAVMLKDIAQYDRVLEIISKPLLRLLPGHHLDHRGALVVQNNRAALYQFFDLTRHAEYLFQCIQRAIAVDLRNELSYLAGYDRARQRLSEIVDLPSSKLNLLMTCVMQNQGRLSKKKRLEYFAMLTDEEISSMEQIFQEELPTESTSRTDKL